MRYDYGVYPDGERYLRSFSTQEAGEVYTTEFSYDRKLPTFITRVLKVNSAGESVSLSESKFNHEVGAIDYQESKIFGEGGSGAPGETVAGFRIEEREVDGERRPTRITYLATGKSQRFSYIAGGGVLVSDVAKSGVVLREREFRAVAGQQRKVRDKDLLGAYSGEQVYEYDAQGRVVRIVGADGSVTVITRVGDAGDVEKREEVTPLGVRVVTKYDVTNGRVESVETRWPSGVSELVSYRYELASTGEVTGVVTGVVRTMQAVSGEVREERLGGEGLF